MRRRHPSGKQGKAGWGQPRHNLPCRLEILPFCLMTHRMAHVWIEKNVAAGFADKLAGWCDAPVLALVSDEQTWSVQAEALSQQLGARHTITPIHLGKKPKASLDVAGQIAAQAQSAQAIVSVGSGTITDLCKHAAHGLNLPHIAVATAPSMNGYTSSTASLYDGKHKHSFSVRQPLAVAADVEVLASAPRRLIRAGLGDVLCRSTVQADWLLSHLLLGTPYDAALYDRWLPLEAEMIAQSIRLTEKDPTFIKLLMRLLIISGEAMHQCGSSAPASQGEHMIAHLYEMVYGNPVESFHGEQIGVTCLTMTRIQDKILLRTPRFKPLRYKPEQFARLFGKDLAAPLGEAYRAKVEKIEAVGDAGAKLTAIWPEVKAQMEAIRVKSTLLENALKKAGCPTTHRDLSWHKDRYEHAVTHAHLTRERFTFLDLMAMDVGVRIEV